MYTDKLCTQITSYVHILIPKPLSTAQTNKGQRHRYSILIHELQTSDLAEHQAAVMAFINYIVSGCSSLDARVKVQSELRGECFVVKYNC